MVCDIKNGAIPAMSKREKDICQGIGLIYHMEKLTIYGILNGSICTYILWKSAVMMYLVKDGI